MKIIKALILSLVLANPLLAMAQNLGGVISTSTGAIMLQSGGTPLGGIRIINCVGAGITCTRSGAIASIAVQNYYLPLGGGTMSGAILFSPDNTIDIGASGATRPRTVYVGTSVSAPQVQGGEGSGNNLTLTSTTNGTKGFIYLGAKSAYDQTQDYLGINTTTPSSDIQINRQDSPVFLTFQAFANVGVVPESIFSSTGARGSIASPSNVANGDHLGRFNFDGFLGLGYSPAAYIRALVDGSPGTAVPGQLQLSTFNSSGSNGGGVFIRASGSVGVDNASPGYPLDVTGAINTDTGYKISGAAAAGNVLRGNGVNFVSAQLKYTDLDFTGATSTDNLTQYALLAGRSGGQTLDGDTAASGNLTLGSTSNATKGKILIGSSMAFDEANTREGIGTTSPSFDFHVVKNGSFVQAQASYDTYDASGLVLAGSLFNFRAARGTSASPTVVSSGDTVFSLASIAFGNTSFTQNAGIKGIVDGAFAGNTIPGRLEFYTHGGNGSSLALRLTITKTGEVVATAPVRLKGYTVATLPAANQGDTAFVTDALGPTYLVPIVGGGAVVTPVFYDGTNWVSY